ncbi:MAG: tRNA (N6-isopentenyl adenosine(37)-C2)-methylthiotransferase MiaB, partial [bacterium]
KKHKAAHPKVLIGVLGCMAARARQYLESLPFVDFLLGPEELISLPDVLSSLFQKRGIPLPKTLPPIKYQRKKSVTAYINIIYGCNNFCSYCVVPFVRGRERSRPPEEILTEIREVANCGFPEVMLLGQNVNAYGKEIPGWDFEKLLEEVSKVEGILRIRYTTSHPRDFTKSLVLKIKELPKVCEHFHLPVQSGSNKILKSMRRGYSKEQYLELVFFIREQIPDSSITTDLIVGYPEESEKEFLETVDLMEKVRFDSAYILTYSPRPGTSAFSLGDPIPQKEKMSRLYYLQDKQKEHALFRNLSLKGQTVEVLVEGKDPKGHLVGRTRTNKEVFFHSEDALIGKLVQVEIEEVTPWSLKGKIP